MKTFLLLVVVVAGVMAAPKRRIAPLSPPQPDADTIPNQYIVVFENDASEEDVQKHKEMVSGMLAQLNSTYSVRRYYRIGNFRAYASEMDARTLEHVREMREVAYVDRNEVVKAFCESQANPPWGIARIQQRDGIPQTFAYDENDGTGVDVYIIDTGIETSHPDFRGKARCGYDFVNNDDTCKDEDPNGHGTHVAGTVMADKYGIARGATSVAVRVLNSFGSGSWEDVIAGIEWVARNGGGKKSVANMSLGGGRSTAVNSAVEAAAKEGIRFAIAAGNERQDACNVSPASAKDGILTTAASDISDSAASFSNYGECVEIIAPGVNIESTWRNGGTNTISGTSMAAPHVAGVMARILTNDNKDPFEMEAYLKEIASKGKISGYNGENDFLYDAPC